MNIGVTMNSTDKEYLTFILQEEEYGIDILYVQEIRVWSSVTELPNKPNYVKGVVNLRGIIIPVIDLRLRFDLEPFDYNEQTVMIILRDPDVEARKVISIVVDSVSDVYRISENLVKSAPDFGSHIDNCFLYGLASIDEKLIILLDTKKLLDQEELYNAVPSESITGVVI